MLRFITYTTYHKKTDIPLGSKPGNFPVFITSDLRHNSDINALASLRVYEQNFYSNMSTLIQSTKYVTAGEGQVYGCTENELDGNTITNQLNVAAEQNIVIPGWGLTANDGQQGTPIYPVEWEIDGIANLTNESGLIPFWNRRTQVWINEYTKGDTVTPYPPVPTGKKPMFKKHVVTAEVDGFGFWKYNIEDLTFKNMAKWQKGNRKPLKDRRMTKVQQRKLQFK